MGKSKTVILPAYPKPDHIIAAAILVNEGKASEVKTISVLPHERWMLPVTDAIPVGVDVDYEKIHWRSYTEVVVSEHNIPRTPEIQRLIKLADKNVQRQTEIGSFSDFINTCYSAQYWHKGAKFSDEEIVEEGIQCVSDLIQFSKLKLQRDNWSIEILQREVQKVGAEKIPRLVKYLQQITAGMRIDCDLVELLTARKHLRGEAKAQEFATKIIEAYNLANQVFQAAIQICKEKTIAKRVPKGMVVAATTDNPTFVGAANVWFKKPTITIQQLHSGHVQIFANISEEAGNDLITLLRAEELKLSKRDEYSLSKERESPEVPEWFYCKSPYGSLIILNGSIRTGAKSIAPTKISLTDIVNFAELVLRTRV